MLYYLFWIVIGQILAIIAFIRDGWKLAIFPEIFVVGFICAAIYNLPWKTFKRREDYKTSGYVKDYETSKYRNV